MPHILAALAIAIGSWIGVPGGSWAPAAADIAAAQIELQPFLSRQAAARKERLAAWGSYTIQYQGHHLDGQRVILVNGFCSPPPSTVTQQLVVAEDGGTCFFRAYWDPKSKLYVHVEFNGHA